MEVDRLVRSWLGAVDTPWADTPLGIHNCPLCGPFKTYMPRMFQLAGVEMGRNDLWVTLRLIWKMCIVCCHGNQLSPSSSLLAKNLKTPQMSLNCSIVPD